jgi:hypothetical protein
MSRSPERRERNGAACTIFRDGPLWDGHASATIGQFSCPDAVSGAALLSDAVEALRSEGYRSVIGPMDGDTWHSYRLISTSDGSPPFLMEPRSGTHDLEAFSGAGFEAISTYVSARATLEDAIGNGAPIAIDGLTIRSWDGTDAEGLIRKLFAMSAASFAGNAFFKPIAEEAFLALYRPLMAAVDPRFVLFAFTSDGAIAGFLFGMPNHLEGPRPSRIILKTYASRVRGTGRMLADTFHRTARNQGFSHVIHALMHDDNISNESSRRFNATVFRRYALMGRKLAP